MFICKIKNRLFLSLVALYLMSCKTSNTIFQVSNLSIEKQYPKSGDTSEVFRVVNNFWNLNGDFSFYVLNKTDLPIKVDLENSYLVINGYSYNIYSELLSKTKKTITTTLATSEFVMTEEEKVETIKNPKHGIAPLAFDLIPIGKDIASNFFSDCKTDSIESTGQTNREFDFIHSPLRFYYYLTVLNASGDTLTYWSPTYFVSKYVTVNQKEFTSYKGIDECGRPAQFLYRYYNFADPKRFFVVGSKL